MRFFTKKLSSYAAISMLMTLIAVIFLYIMGNVLIQTTESYQQVAKTENVY